MTDGIKLQKLTKIYQKKVCAVHNVSFDFMTGKLYAIMGASGSGKSTLLNLIGLLDVPTSGRMTIDGTPTDEMKQKDFTHLRRDKIGFVFQSYMLNPKLNAVENVMLPMLATDKYYKECKEKALSLLIEVGLDERYDHFPYQLSGGEQQRVAIARALGNSPTFILADEPTGNLDEFNEELIFNKFKIFAKSGGCAIVVTHNPKIFQYADCILTMSRGEIANEQAN